MTTKPRLSELLGQVSHAMESPDLDPIPHKRYDPLVAVPHSPLVVIVSSSPRAPVRPKWLAPYEEVEGIVAQDLVPDGNGLCTL